MSYTNFIQKITDTDGTTHDLLDSSASHFIKGTQTASTNVWTGPLPDGVTDYYDGLMVDYWLPFAGTSTAATLNLGGKGAKPVYRGNAATSGVTTHIAAKTVAHLTYVVDSGINSGNGAWIMSSYYDSDSNTVDRLRDSYFRPYAGEAVYRYKFVMQGADNRMYPITLTNQENTTQVAKVPTQVGLRPGRIWFYNTTATVAAGGLFAANTLDEAYQTTAGVYNFNTNAPTYRMIYLRGTYNKTTDLFTLYKDSSSPCTSYYTYVPTNTANITLSNYFTSGYYYILLGGTYSTANYISLFPYNPLYYFDGTNLIPASTKVAQDNDLTAAQINGVATYTSDALRGWSQTSVDGILSAVDSWIDEAEDAIEDIPVGAEVNQNAFSNVKVGSTTIAADTKTDTLELAAGSNITLTPDATNDKVTIAFNGTIPDVPSNIVNTITTTAGAHTAITSQKGDVSFNVPTTAAHVGAASSSHTHGNITNGGDITATAPTIASGDQIVINDHSASKITNGPTFDGSTTTTALTPKGTWESFAKNDTNTTYALSGALSSHKYTSTLTAGGSGSGTSTSDLTLAAGTGITITDDTTNRKMTIATTAETNQNAFSNVKVGDTTIAADSKTDTLELVAGSHISLVPNSTDDKVTFNVGWPYEGSLSILRTGTDTGQRTWPANAIADYVNEVGEAVAGLIPNTFSNVKVGSTTIAADSKTDTLELVAGTGVTLTPDATNDKVTISATSSGGGMVNLQDGTGTGSIEMSNASAVKSYQTALGKYNKEDTGTDKDLSNFAFIIGDGSSSSARSNLFTINNSGLVTTHPFSSDYNWKTSSAAPNETQYFTGFEIRDRDEVRLSHIDTHIDTTGKVGTVLGAERMVGNDIIRNQIYLYVDAAGTKSYIIDAPVAFRHALDIYECVTEQGTSGIWTYRKWSSGIAECWGMSSSTSYAVTNQYVNGYYANLGTVSFPSGLFVAAPCVQATRTNTGSGSALIFLSLHTVTASSFAGFVSATSSGTYPCQFSYHAIGRWKNS